jgi:SAM-dependent methyltransferase
MAPIDVIRNLARRYGLRNPVAKPRAVNDHVPTPTPEDLAYQIEYAVTPGALQVWRLEGLGIPIAGARILEIGPGVAFGTAAYLCAAGAHVTVADRWLSRWSDPYHGPIYSGIADKLEGKPGFDVTPLRRMVAAKGYVDGTITCLLEPSEALASIADGAFDAVLSNAVLEHIETPAKAFPELYRVTRPGGVGLHQVDYRDHRGFDTPLEHLLMKPAAFDKLNHRFHMEYGSQRRQPDYANHLTAAGFTIERYESSEAANPAYLDDVMKRLAASGRSQPGWSREVLSDLGGLFFLRRPSTGR